MDKELKKHGEKLRECIYQFISDYISEHSYAPTVKEIGVAVGLKSSSSVHSHLAQLECQGRIEIKPYCHRAIRVIEKEE